MENIGLIIQIGAYFVLLIWILHGMTKKITGALSGIKESLDKILEHLDEKSDKQEE